MSEEVERTLEKFLESVKGVTCFRKRFKIYPPTCSVLQEVAQSTVLVVL
ncbi:MAG: hypothetical protein QXK07_08240 [Desulfurococcaceae archaeon]